MPCVCAKLWVVLFTSAHWHMASPTWCATAFPPDQISWSAPDVDRPFAECQYCAALNPILEQASELIGSEASIAKLDMRGTFAINRDFDVRSAPTLILFKEGVEADRSREDLAAIRDARAIASYVRMHTGPDVLSLHTLEKARSS